MPRGARHIETGILRPGCLGYSLHLDGGGIWELDVTRSMRKLLGQRVTVEGTRAGFNLLDVTKVLEVNDVPVRTLRLSVLDALSSLRGLPDSQNLSGGAQPHPPAGSCPVSVITR